MKSTIWHQIKNGKIMLSMRSEKNWLANRSREENRVKEVDAITNKQNSKQNFCSSFSSYIKKSFIQSRDQSDILAHVFHKKIQLLFEHSKKIVVVCM